MGDDRTRPGMVPPDRTQPVRSARPAPAKSAPEEPLATRVTGGGRALSPRALELGKSFLSALFMASRTAQIHDAQNRAFDRAVQGLLAASESLYRAVGAFSLAFVDESAFLNGSRLRIDGGMFGAVRALRGLLEAREMGGLEIRQPPTYDVVRKLVLIFAPQGAAEVATKDELLAEQIRALGVQRFEDRARGAGQIDRRLFALQCYAKLLLAVREQQAGGRTGRVKAVRVVQDLVELLGDRMDFVLRLGSNRAGATMDELHAVNTSLLSLVLAHALGLPRAALVDVGVGALFHDLGRGPAVGRTPEPPETPPAELPFGDATDRSALELEAESLIPEGLDDVLERVDARAADPIASHPEEGVGAARPAHALAGFARLLALGGIGRSGLTRALIAAEHHHGAAEDGGRPHLFARLVAVADAYDALTSGLATGQVVPPLDALGQLMHDASGRLDPDLVDLLVNCLRAFPQGSPVGLDDGRRAVVVSHAGSSRWDRPVVRLEGGERLDLMRQEDGRFVRRIVGTTRFLERVDEVQPLPLSEGDLVAATAVEAFPPALSAADLAPAAEEPLALAEADLSPVEAGEGPLELSPADLIQETGEGAAANPDEVRPTPLSEEDLVVETLADGSLILDPADAGQDD